MLSCQLPPLRAEGSKNIERTGNRVHCIPWHSSKFPFTTNVRPWSKDDKKVVILARLKKSSQVQKVRKVKAFVPKIRHPFHWLMKVPRDIAGTINDAINFQTMASTHYSIAVVANNLHIYRVQSGCAEFCQSVVPIIRMKSEVVQTSAD